MQTITLKEKSKSHYIVRCTLDKGSLSRFKVMLITTELPQETVLLLVECDNSKEADENFQTMYATLDVLKW
jgi:hypothetical protein